MNLASQSQVNPKPSSKSKHILLGVTGCIAAYKSAELIRLLVTNEFEVRVILTRSACQFVTETTMATLSQNPIHTDLYEADLGWFPRHIELAQWADLFVIAPLSANCLAKIAHGLADDLLTNTVLAYEKELMLAPSMNDQMYANPMVQDNLQRIGQVSRYRVIDPESGFLACLSDGPGRLPDANTLLHTIQGYFEQ